MIHTFRVVLIDHDPAARATLRQKLEQESDFEVVAEATSGTEAVDVLESKSPDVAFLGVQLPRMDAFEVLERASLDRLPAIVFVSQPEAPAIQALRAQAIAYLLKPIQDASFREVLRGVRRVLHSGHDADRIERLLSLIAEPPGRSGGDRYVSRLVVREGGTATFLAAEEIVWIEAAGNYVRVHASSGSHLLRRPLAELEQKLDPDEFARIHRSMIVNLSRVEAVRQGRDGEHTVVLEGGRRLRLGRAYRDRLRRGVH